MEAFRRVAPIGRDLAVALTLAGAYLHHAVSTTDNYVDGHS
jgi:hypothetical protein